MNLKGRYDMLRQATLQMVGMPSDDLDNLKQMAAHLQIPATHDADAAVSLLVLQTLIATHSDTHGHDDCTSTDWATVSTGAGAMKRCTKCGHVRFPTPEEVS